MLCVHCLKDAGSTKDHVFPSSWYPDNTETSVQRPTVPSCASCNNNLGTIEKDLFLKLAMCIDPKKIGAQGLNKRFLVSLGIGVDPTEITPLEAKARLKTLLKLIRPATPYKPGIKALPGLGLHAGYEPEKHMVIPVPHEELTQVSEKIIRGLEYKLAGRYIQEPLRLKVYFIENFEAADRIDLLLENHGTKTAYGPGFLVERVETNDGTHPTMLYKISIWDTLTIYASIMTPNEQSN